LALERLGVDPAHIVFIEDGPVRPGELASVIGAVNATRCQILFVALGVPKQDFVCRTLRAACPGLVCVGVGGSFEVLAGLVPRAPRWLRECGFEWLFRLMNEPLRLWRRYLLLYPRALPAIARWTRAVTKGYRLRGRKSTSHPQHAGDRASPAQTLAQHRPAPAPKSPVTH
jgi:UDP-N-acetyl-D-mannosaminuronic acid transferase (WecB/TagA/CpsF family)